MTARIFIDGSAGTTGLQIAERLDARTDITLVHSDPELRKDTAHRKELLNSCDIAILCLPDESAREAVSLIENPETRVIDASSVHRTHHAWVYGFPELDPAQREKIATAKRVTNPGCYATGAIALIAPLIQAGLVVADHPLSINAVSGYSGGGRQMIEAYGKPGHGFSGARAYGLHFDHKHIPEIMIHGGLNMRPIFLPTVSDFYRGMAVHIPLHIPGNHGDAFQACLAAHYNQAHFVSVASSGAAAAVTYLNPQAMNDTNHMRLYVFHSLEHDQIVLSAVLDNLGKGASGAAVQNMNIMLGLDEKTGLEATPTSKTTSS